MPFGTAWNKAENYGENLRSFSRWAQEELGGLELSCSFEFPYANVSGIEVSTAAARGFGRDLARALARYLREI